MRAAVTPDDHVGLYIRQRVMKPRSLSVNQMAAALGASRVAVSAMLNGRAGLSPMMALRIERAFGTRMETLLEMQLALQIAATRRQAGRR